MGLFSRKSVVTSTASVNKPAVIKNLTDVEAESLFADLFSMANRISNMASRSIDPVKAREDYELLVVKVLGDVKTEWVAIDRFRVSAEDSAFMYSVLVTGMPAILVALSALSKSGLSFALESSLTVEDSDLRGLRAGEGLNFYLSRLIGIRDAQWQVDYAARVPKATLAVPVTVRSDYELRKAVEDLHELWVQANKRSLGSADRFYVDEVAARYFPDSWRMLERFDSDDEALMVEARLIFLEQVNVMGKHLEKLVTKTHNEALEQMRSHSSFLQGLTS